MSPAGRPLRATWVPSRARLYRRPGGPWSVPPLDTLIAAGGGEVVAGGHRFTHDQMEAMVARVAGGLAARGARRGRAVAWQLPNGAAAAVLYRACWRLGAVAAPVLHSLGPTEAALALDQIDPAVVVDPAQAPDPAALIEHLGATAVPAGAVAVRPSDLAVVLFTSGSTGTPKAVLHSHRALAWKALLMAGVHGLGRGDAVLMPAPLAHVSGLLNGVLLPGVAGLRSVLVRRFDPAQALELVGRERISFLAGPPTFFVAMASVLREDPAAGDTTSIRLVSSGGASVTPAFVRSTAEAFGCRVKRTYGSTEAPTVTTSTNADPATLAAETDGRAVGEVELVVVDPDGHPVGAPGRPGELWVRGPELFCGYADPAETARVLARGGWFRTGDLATVDAQGWLRIVGRLKDVIIRGGENISASEVEGVLESHPDVVQAVVVGYPDELMGERACAFVVATAPFTLAACRRWFEHQGIARFKTPERVVRLDHLPLLGTGKPDRAGLRRRAADPESAA